MGRETIADIVPFVAHYVFENSCHFEDDEYYKLVSPTRWVEDYGPDEFLDDPESAPIVVRGWKKLQDKNVGKKNKGLWGWEWVRVEDEVSVILVNESEYGHVDEHEIAVVADEEFHITAFLEDFKDLLDRNSPTIEVNDIVKVTM